MSSRNRTNVTRLLEYWCEVQIQDSDRDKPFGTYIPDSYICECFPDNFREIKVMQNIPAFAFPCAYESESVQSYSFVLTTDDSKWRFGFCRQDPKTGTAMVLITFLPWHDTFLRFLTVLAEIRRTSRDEFRTFIAEAYNGGVPKPGSDLKLYYNGGQSTFVFERPLQFQLPSIPGNHNLNLYYNFVDPKNMIAVFAAMLAERRIIFTSRRLDKLSSCIQAANAFLYPMVWQHIFIPVLPMKLKDYLSAPMPYLIGVPKSVLDTMMPEELGEVVILNCDTKIFESPFDDVHELPTEIVSQLKKQLSHSSEHVGDRVSKIFLGVLVQLIGGYRDAVEFHDVGKCFNRKTFIESRPSHIRPFLEKMMELQIFQQFIDERLEMLNTGLGFSDEFEMETVRYAEKMKKRNRNLAFIRTVKDKTNPAVKSAVKSVKEGSRGVKTAYKDLKSKFRDITPPSNPHFRSHLASNSQHDRIDGYVGGKSVIGHHSAPSSPIFSKRTVAGCGSGSNLPSITAGGFQYASPEEINGATQSMRRTNPLAMSSSSSHIHSNGHTGSAINTSHHHNRLASSPTVSPASSLCSSEMNLSQELQNHPLFKSPIVDRSLESHF
ncbi:DENN domain-containing protein 1A isoform X5 [Teleopsis dalmanni]|uniref:DENN domain-containing protein 1A isoform X5 n=1 Tax=Teleopsis dalmanni TaxID=139649 RepID=UPI0018CF48E4|nr:DENN domain-containing protein 1A isoform X5 [Teleopsis dalmanni]